MAETAEERPRVPRGRRRNVARIVVPIVIVMLLAAGGYYVWKRMNTYESTDDAQIDGHINSISARISGNVIQAPVEDQTVVKAGDVLVRIDPKDYEVAVSKAQADLADDEAALLASRADVPIISTNTASQLKTARSTRVDASAAVAGAQRQLDAAQARLESAKAQVREAEANYKKARDDVARYKQLVDKDEIPRQQYDTAVSTAEAFKATLDARLASVAEAEQNIRVARGAERGRAGEHQTPSGRCVHSGRPYGPAAGGGERSSRQVGPSTGRAEEGVARAGEAQPELLRHRRSRQRDRRQEDRGNRSEYFPRPAVNGRGSPR